ncbi:6143_t:CDS:2 [Entrophospora sp. SA101]|nr:6143_t:CDS:2 [Entrophospora sp. SA101]
MHTSKVLASGIEIAESVSAINNNLDVAKQALGVIDAVEAFKPFVPFIGMFLETIQVGILLILANKLIQYFKEVMIIKSQIDSLDCKTVDKGDSIEATKISSSDRLGGPFL